MRCGLCIDYVAPLEEGLIVGSTDDWRSLLLGTYA